jgi:DUF1009 family protein
MPPPASRGEESLAIICGGGSIPRAVADAVARSGRRVVLFAVRGWAEPATVQSYPHHWVSLGQYGRFLRLLQAEGCRDIVAIGTMLRPSITQVRLDWHTLRVLPRIWRAFRGGDDHMLSSLGRIMEDDGYRLVAAHEVAPSILVPMGPLGSRAPGERDQADIALALALLRATGPFDVGQAAVVAAGHVLAIEAAEGTDRMLARIAEMRRAGRVSTRPGTGVLVKAPKPGQDRRFDLPSIGPQTVDGVAEAGLAGMAVLAGATVLAEPQRTAQRADDAGVFVAGVADEGPAR